MWKSVHIFQTTTCTCNKVLSVCLGVIKLNMVLKGVKKVGSALYHGISNHFKRKFMMLKNCISNRSVITCDAL